MSDMQIMAGYGEIYKITRMIAEQPHEIWKRDRGKNGGLGGWKLLAGILSAPLVLCKMNRDTQNSKPRKTLAAPLLEFLERLLLIISLDKQRRRFI